MLNNTKKESELAYWRTLVKVLTGLAILGADDINPWK